MSDKHFLKHGSQEHKMLQAYALHPTTGLTDRAAYKLTDIGEGAMFWARCNSLRAKGYIRHIQDFEETGNGGLGQKCIITPLGQDMLRQVTEQQRKKEMA